MVRGCPNPKCDAVVLPVIQTRHYPAKGAHPARTKRAHRCRKCRQIVITTEIITNGDRPTAWLPKPKP